MFIMTESDAAPTGRIGRPPKVDENGIPTRDRLLQAAVDACIEFGYEGVTLSDIARRAQVSTPAVYCHFDGKAALLVEACKHELDKISSGRLRDAVSIRGVVQQFLAPGFARTRVLLSELHNAAHRQPEVATFLAAWQRDNGRVLQERAGFTPAQVHIYYLLLLGATHVDAVTGLGVEPSALNAEMAELIDGWLGTR